METNKKELIMIGVVPYQLKGIQGGIQFKHASDEYPIKYGFDDPLYQEWVRNHKTVCVLNGGTTNNNKESIYYGSLNKLRDKLEHFGIRYSEFYEPDFGDQLAGITLICEREVRYKDYLSKGEFVIYDDMSIHRFDSMIGDIDSDHPNFYKKDSGIYEYTKDKIVLNILVGNLPYAT